MMEVVVTTGAVSRAKLQSNPHHQVKQTDILCRSGPESPNPLLKFPELGRNCCKIFDVFVMLQGKLH